MPKPNSVGCPAASVPSKGDVSCGSGIEGYEDPPASCEDPSYLEESGGDEQGAGASTSAHGR